MAQRIEQSRSESRRRSRVRAAVFGLLSLTLVGFAALTGCMERLFYYPSRAEFQTPPRVEDVYFETEDGLTLHGWFIPADPRSLDGDAPAPVVLTPHGNAGNVSHHYPFVDFLPRAGFSVFLFDYRSYGRSDRGRLRREPLIRDTRAALDALLARDDIDHSRIALFGLSIGGVIGLPVAAEREEIRSVVLMSPFASWKGIAADHSWLLGRALIPSGFDAIDQVRKLGDRPVLIVHGDNDEVVPVEHAGRLEQAAKDAGVDIQVRISPGAMHNDLFWVDPGAENAIIEFLRETLGASDE